MKSKPASLSLHRNTVERRRKREMARDLVTGVRNMTRDRDIRAYAVVGIGSDGRAYALWDTGSVMPMWAFAETMGAVLREDVMQHSDMDDWRPPLVPQKSGEVE